MPSLCIRPFSPTEARKLVETPLAYLGFRFCGDEGKNHLATILYRTNYYPGLLHKYCYELIESVYRKYEEYYSEQASDKNPPFILQKEHISRIIEDAKLNDKIREFFNLNLELDRHYKIISTVIAYLSHLDRRNGSTHPDGFSLREIKDCDGWKIPILMNITDKELETLLSEMDEMGILFHDKVTKCYDLRRNSFLEMLGEIEVIGDTLLEFKYAENVEGNKQ
jgi:hypothetical protein